MLNLADDPAEYGTEVLRPNPRVLGPRLGKDVQTVIAAAKSGASTPLGAQAEALYALFDGLGHGGRDFSAMLQMLRGRLSEL